MSNIGDKEYTCRCEQTFKIRHLKYDEKTREVYCPKCDVVIWTLEPEEILLRTEMLKAKKKEVEEAQDDLNVALYFMKPADNPEVVQFT